MTHHDCVCDREAVHVALTTAGLFAFVNEFAMSVGMSQSHLRSGIFCDIFLSIVTDTSLRRSILATTVMMRTV